MDTKKVLEKHGFKPVHKDEVWWKAGKDPVVANVVYDHMSAGYNVVLIHVFGPETEVPAFSTGELSTEWALDRQLTDMFCPLYSVESGGAVDHTLYGPNHLRHLLNGIAIDWTKVDALKVGEEVIHTSSPTVRIKRTR